MPSATESSSTALPFTNASLSLFDHCLTLVGDDLAAAEDELRGLLHSSIAVIPEIGGHLALAGGKRLRPLLTLLCAQAAGYDDPARITVAAVGELLHTATLLHDDVVDEGEFRRGRPAARMRFGNGLAVLAGDYYLAQALSAVGALGDLGAVQSMANTVTRMAEGEVAQLHAAGDPTLDRARYMAVIERKTATLIAWCSSVAGLVGPRHGAALRRYGLELGYAFQIADDVIDVLETTATMGKDRGQDVREGKMTLPLILACERDPALYQQLAEALHRGPPMASETVADVLEAIDRSGGAIAALEVAREHSRAAMAALDALPPSAPRRALEAIAEYTVTRHR